MRVHPLISLSQSLWTDYHEHGFWTWTRSRPLRTHANSNTHIQCAQRQSIGPQCIALNNYIPYINMLNYCHFMSFVHDMYHDVCSSDGGFINEYRISYRDICDHTNLKKKDLSSKSNSQTMSDLKNKQNVDCSFVNFSFWTFARRTPRQIKS